MARHPRPRPRLTARAAQWLKDRWPETQYHRTHPWFMTYAYCSALAALLVVLWVVRGIS